MQITTFLTESLNPEQFPLLVKYWTQKDSDRGVKRLNRVLAQMNQYQSGPIPNAEFVALKDDANRLLDFSYFGVMANLSPESMDEIRKDWSRYTNIDDYTTSTPVHVAGKLKKAEAAAKKVADDPIYREFYDNVIPKMKEFLPLSAALEDLKGRAVKRQPKEKDTPASLKAKYVAPMASNEAGKLVIDALTALSEKLKVVYADEMFREFQNRAKEFASKPVQGQYDSREHFTDLLSMHAAWDRTPEYVTAKADRFNRERQEKWWHHKLADLADDTFRKVADQAAQDMQDQFVVKNAQKLASIVDKKSHKSQLKEEPKPVGSLDVSARGTIAGDLMFKFDDGSSFRVRNKVVWKSRYSNNYGSGGKYTHYVQFPTTFHDVTLPDKTMMSTPSEQRMNDVFAVA